MLSLLGVKSLFVHADAAVRGPLYDDRISGRPQRRKRGPSTAGCVAWEGVTASSPAFQTSVRLEGVHGPQTAEYEALTVGLAKVLLYLVEERPAISDAVLYSDNEMVINTLHHARDASELKPYRATARTVQDWIEYHGVAVHYEHVRRKDRRHMQAHALAERAWRLPLH